MNYMKIVDIIQNRIIEGRKFIFIETEDNYYTIKGSYIRIAESLVIDAFYTFKNNADISWNYVEKRVYLNNDRDHWKHLSDFGYQTDLSIESIYSNGENITEKIKVSE